MTRPAAAAGGTILAAIFVLVAVAMVRGQAWTYVEVTRDDGAIQQTMHLWAQASGNAVLEVRGADGVLVERRSCTDGVLVMEDSVLTASERHDISPEACTQAVMDAVYGVWRFVSTSGIQPSGSRDIAGQPSSTYAMPESYELYEAVTLADDTHLPLQATLRSGGVVKWTSGSPTEVDGPPTVNAPRGDVYEALDSNTAASVFGRSIPEFIDEFALVRSEMVHFASRPEQPLYGLIWRSESGAELQAMLDVGMAEATSQSGLSLTDPAQATLRLIEGGDVLTLVAPDVQSLGALAGALRPGTQLPSPDVSPSP